MPDDPLTLATNELYGAEPDEFMDRRAALVKAARAGGSSAEAKRIGALRKPTRSAYVVNVLARTDPEAIGRLLDLGERWRAAEKSVDAAQIRELTRDRRRLIDELTRAAFAAAGEADPSSGVRDEVVATLTAALSDDAVADEVERGVLVKPARWEGFGFGGPDLTVVSGGESSPTRARHNERATVGRSPDDAGPPGARPTPAERRAAEAQAQAEQAARQEKEAAQAREVALADARRAVDEAEDNLVLATDDEQARTDRVHELEEELSDARKAVDGARREVRRAEIAQRRAQGALRRLEQAGS